MRPADDCVVLSPGSPSSLLCGEIASEAFSESSLADLSSKLAFSLSLLPVSSSGFLSGAATYSVLTGSGSFFSGAAALGIWPLLISSWSPCANRQRSPYLQTPFSRKFLHISYFNLTYALGACAVTALWFEFDAEADELLALSFSSFGACCYEEELDLCSEEDGVDRRDSFSNLLRDFSVFWAAGTHFLAGLNFFFRW